MDLQTAPPLERQLAAALAWWREAGVDHIFTDEPHPLLRATHATEPNSASPAPSQPERKAPAPRPTVGGSAADLPQDLAAFHAWWLAEPSLEVGGTGVRIPARGAVEPALMVLVPMPEATDRDTLLSGPEGRLVAGMLGAMGIPEEAFYLAAALPRHMAQPDWQDLEKAGMAAIVRHHVALVQPQRLLVLGHGILPLLGHDRSQAPASIKETVINGATTGAVPTLVGVAPDRLLGNARQRALLWRQWLEWTKAQ